MVTNTNRIWSAVRLLNIVPQVYQAVDSYLLLRYNNQSNIIQALRNNDMQICDITGKGKQYGNNVSFSQRHTKKVWKPNLQNKTIIVDGKKVSLKISTQALRTLKKKG